MENSFFVFTTKNHIVEIERFHICTWEFNSDKPLVEFGFEIKADSVKEASISISILIPWLTKGCKIDDLFENLCIAENSRFIFNDSIIGTDSLDGGRNKLGVIHKFSNRNELCILPVQHTIESEKVIQIFTDTQPYLNYKSDSKPNLYVRILVEPAISNISIIKKGISKSTIIYDTKVNEKRNIPDDRISYFIDKDFCKIKSCFSFNIIPNKYDIVFLDNPSLQSVRTLEYEAFKKYLGDKRVKKDELIVIFNKKIQATEDNKSFSFFTIYSKERIGIAQFSSAILLNLFCSFLFFMAATRNPPTKNSIKFFDMFSGLPKEVYFALAIMVITLGYFMWPTIVNLKKRLWTSVKQKNKKK